MILRTLILTHLKKLVASDQFQGYILLYLNLSKGFSGSKQGFPMGILSVSRCVLIGALLLVSVSFCYGDDPPYLPPMVDQTVEVVGLGECADCKESNIKTSQAFSGNNKSFFLLFFKYFMHLFCFKVIISKNGLMASSY